MKRRTDFNLIKGIRKYYLNNMARLVYYTWQDEYKINHLKEFHQKISGALDNKKISLAYLTAKQLEDIGFGKWDYKDGKALYLVPLWLWPHIKDTQRLVDLDRSPCVYNKIKEDNDERFGSCAYGILRTVRNPNHAC